MKLRRKKSYGGRALVARLGARYLSTTPLVIFQAWASANHSIT